MDRKRTKIICKLINELDTVEPQLLEAREKSKTIYLSIRQNRSKFHKKSRNFTMAEDTEGPY